MNDAPLLLAPRCILFDWHGTLVDTLDAMYAAMDEVLPQFEELGLVERLLEEADCLNADDVKLVRYIRIYRRLHPKILAERRISRTDIFNAIFGDDTEAKNIAHHAYNQAYRKHYGKVHAFQQGIPEYLAVIKSLGIEIGVATNRIRDFFDLELQLVDDGEWLAHITTSACSDDVTHYKPSPEVINAALSRINLQADRHCWYVGDSYQDMVTAKNAGVTAIFYNGGSWDQAYLDNLFQLGERQHHAVQPDAIIHSFEQLMALLLTVQTANPEAFRCSLADNWPASYPAPQPPPARIEPDWHPATASLSAPTLILFDWHATLVDTLDAMYHAVDEMLPELRHCGLLDRMADPVLSRSDEDARLIEYVQSHSQLHPKIKADRKISRTDIFEVLFADDQGAKQIAHKMFNHYYRKHQGPELRKIINHHIRFIGILLIARKQFIQPGLIPLRTIEKNGRHSRSLGGDNISGTIPDIPNIGSRFLLECLGSFKQLIRIRFALLGIITANLSIKQASPSA